MHNPKKKRPVGGAAKCAAGSRRWFTALSVFLSCAALQAKLPALQRSGETALLLRGLRKRGGDRDGLSLIVNRNECQIGVRRTAIRFLGVALRRHENAHFHRRGKSTVHRCLQRHDFAEANGEVKIQFIHRSRHADPSRMTLGGDRGGNVSRGAAWEYEAIQCEAA